MYLEKDGDKNAYFSSEMMLYNNGEILVSCGKIMLYLENSNQ